MVAKSIQALYNNFSLEPKWVTHPPYAHLGVAVAPLYPLVRSTTVYPQCLTHPMPIWESTHPPYAHLGVAVAPLYPLPTMHEHSITTFDLFPEPCQPHYTHLHPHPTSTWEVASIIPIYSITHFTVLLRIQLLSMIYWYHNWFYLNYNPTSLPMHSLSFVHHVKGTSCQCPRPTTHLQAMILCPQQSLLLICVHGRACVPIILWCTLQEENEFRIQLLIV